MAQEPNKSTGQPAQQPRLDFSRLQLMREPMYTSRSIFISIADTHRMMQGLIPTTPDDRWVAYCSEVGANFEATLHFHLLPEGREVMRGSFTYGGGIGESWFHALWWENAPELRQRMEEGPRRRFAWLLGLMGVNGRW